MIVRNRGWLAVLIGSLCALSGCSRPDGPWIEEARRRSQLLIDSIGTPTGRRLFLNSGISSGYIDTIFRFVADSCDMTQKRGGLAGTRLGRFAPRPDKADFMYVYQCGPRRLRFIVSYWKMDTGPALATFDLKPVDSTMGLPGE